MAGVPGFEPGECQSQSLMPYRLAIPQSGGGGQIWTAEPRGNWFTVNRVWPLRYSSKYKLQAKDFPSYLHPNKKMVDAEGLEPPTLAL